MPYSKINGVELYYEDAGQGQPIIFLHGVWESSRFFHRQLGHFSRRHRAVAPDMRGHGRSKHVHFGHTVAQYACDLRALMQELKLTDVVLVGHSMGAFVLWDYVRQFGVQNLAATVIVDQSASDFKWADWPLGYVDFAALCHFMAAVQTDRDAFVREITPLLFKQPLTDLDLQQMLGEITRLPPTVASAILFDQTVQDYRTILPNVTVPTLLCFGRDEEVVPLAAGEHLLQNLPDARLVIFEESGHYPFLEEPQRFNAEVEAFVQALG